MSSEEAPTPTVEPPFATFVATLPQGFEPSSRALLVGVGVHVATVIAQHLVDPAQELLADLGVWSARRQSEGLARSIRARAQLLHAAATGVRKEAEAAAVDRFQRDEDIGDELAFEKYGTLMYPFAYDSRAAWDGHERSELVIEAVIGDELVLEAGCHAINLLADLAAYDHAIAECQQQLRTLPPPNVEPRLRRRPSRRRQELRRLANTTAAGFLIESAARVRDALLVHLTEAAAATADWELRDHASVTERFMSEVRDEATSIEEALVDVAKSFGLAPTV
jgi:hypothetical protein